MRVVFLAAAGVGAGLVLHQVLRRIDDLVSAPRRRFRSRHGDVGVGPEYVSKTTYGVVGGAKPPGLRDVPTLVAEMRDAFESGVTLPLEHRRATLRAMRAAFAENEAAILAAVWEDLRRPEGETLYYDFLLVKTELERLLANLGRWTAPRRVRAFSLLTFPSSQWIEREPRGTCLVIGPFNYPFALTAGVVAGAVAAGNNVILKPSNDVPRSSALLFELFKRYVDPRVVSVIGPGIPGDGADVVTDLLRQKLDFVFFTGSTRVGSIIARKAAETLTPCALELGGKNPVFVDATADLSLAAKQCVWGRALNCGQQCIAPEYVLCPRSKLDAFVDNLRRWTQTLIPDPYAEGAMGRLVGWNAAPGAGAANGARRASARVAALLRDGARREARREGGVRRRDGRHSRGGGAHGCGVRLGLASDARGDVRADPVRGAVRRPL